MGNLSIIKTVSTYHLWEYAFPEVILNKIEMKIIVKFILFVILIVAAHNIQAQRLIEVSTCLNPDGSRYATQSVQFFLTWANREDDRIEVGATNETVEQIQPVADEAICSQLNQIVRNNPKYKKVDDNLDSKRTKYYYKTENFYYIFWAKKPAYDNRPSTGPRRLFIIVSADFQNVWEKYY